jgi:hypothetical protein
MGSACNEGECSGDFNRGVDASFRFELQALAGLQANALFARRGDSTAVQFNAGKVFFGSEIPTVTGCTNRKMECRIGTVMNQPSSTDSTNSAAPSDLISRRAYELWEQEGRPEGSDLRHWLQAEQELGAGASNGSTHQEAGMNTSSLNTGDDVRPLQGTRAGAAVSRGGKRGSNSPFGGDAGAARRKPGNAPVL